MARDRGGGGEERGFRDRETGWIGDNEKQRERRVKKSRGGRERKNNGDKGGTLFPRFKEKFKRVSCHWKREEGESLVNEGEEKNVSSKNSSREKKKRKRKKTEDFFRKFLPSIHRFNFASNKKSLLQVTIVPLWCITKEET